jgi:hypothetical protein
MQCILVLLLRRERTLIHLKHITLSQLSGYPSYSTVRVRLQHFLTVVSRAISSWALRLVLTVHSLVTIDKKTKESKRGP